MYKSTALQTIPPATVFDRGWRFLMNHLIQDVPEALALCEFDCRQPDCTPEQWASCERRLRAVHQTRENPGRAA